MDAPTAAPHPEDAGLAHVATVSFLASRVTPTGAFWLALGGGVGLARAAAERGLRSGAAVSVAGMLQTIVLLGPLRVNAPLTQAMSAPVLGALHRRGAGFAGLLAACLGIRVLHYIVLTVVFVWIALGGVDAYVRGFESATSWTGIVPQGRTAVIALTAVYSFLWAAMYSVVQVAVYRRALCRWPEDAAAAGVAAALERAEGGGGPAGADPDPHARAARFDPRALGVAAILAFALLLSGVSGPVIGAVAVWLALAALLAPPERAIARVGLALAAVFAAGTLAGGLLGSLGTEETLLRAARAALLVLVATWLRGAAGPDGMRELFRRMLARGRRWAWARDAADALEQLDSGARLAAAGRAFLARLEPVPKTPGPVADALTAWVAAEARAFTRPPAVAPLRLRPRLVDGGLVVLAALPALAFVAG